MSILLAQFFLASSQCELQLVLQFVKASQFSLHVCQLFLQAALHRGARLQPISSQPQETPNFAQLESQTLHTAYEGQRFQVAFAISPEPTFGSWRFGQQTIALVEPNGINADPDLLCNDANLHCP
jgi:hypothetical protein